MANYFIIKDIFGEIALQWNKRRAENIQSQFVKGLRAYVPCEGTASICNDWSAKN